MNWSALLRLLPALVELIRAVVSWSERRIGKAEAYGEVKKQTDALQEHFDEIERADIPVVGDDDVFVRLRQRAKSSGPDTKAANGNGDPVPPTRPAA